MPGEWKRKKIHKKRIELVTLYTYLLTFTGWYVLHLYLLGFLGGRRLKDVSITPQATAALSALELRTDVLVYSYSSGD